MLHRSSSAVTSSTGTKQLKCEKIFFTYTLSQIFCFFFQTILISIRMTVITVLCCSLRTSSSSLFGHFVQYLHVVLTSSIFLSPKSWLLLHVEPNVYKAIVQDLAPHKPLHYAAMCHVCLIYFRPINAHFRFLLLFLEAEKRILAKWST